MQRDALSVAAATTSRRRGQLSGPNARAAPVRRRSPTDLISDVEGIGVESRSVSLEAAIVTSLTCGVIVAAIGHDRGRGLWEVFLLLTRLDDMVIGALFRL